MKPILHRMTPKKRAILFAPTLLGGFFLLFIILGFSTDQFLASLLVSGAVALAGTVVALGWPSITRKDGSPLIDRKIKPWLFFLLAPLFIALIYPLLGAIITSLRLPPAYSAWVSLGVSILAGCGLAYLLVGFPDLFGGIRRGYADIPRERRPFLFFPLFVLFFIVIYAGLGVGTTQALAKVKGNTPLLLNVQVLVLLPLALVLAALGAYLLVGFPKPRRAQGKILPTVTGRYRPRAFLLTAALLGIPLTVIIGDLITTYAPRIGAGLPSTLILPLAILLGYSLSIGIAALAWGTPARWRQFEDYEPGIPPRARVPLYLGSALITAVVVTVIFGLAGADLFWGMLVGLILGTLIGLQLAGIMGRIAARRNAESLVPDLPDRTKPLVLFPAWFILSFLIFAALTYPFPNLIVVNALMALIVGLGVAWFLVEQTTFRAIRDRRRREKERRRAFEARRKEALRDFDSSGR